MQDVHVKLSPILPWQKQHSTRRRLVTSTLGLNLRKKLVLHLEHSTVWCWRRSDGPTVYKMQYHRKSRRRWMHTWCGYKITGLMLENFYSKNCTIEMLSPSMYSPPWSLHHSMKIFHCWKQCCRSSSDSLFMSSVAFAFTASTDSNLIPFNADFIFGNKKKSHMGLGQVSTVDVPTGWSCASSKTSWQTRRCALARCLGEEPMSRSSTFQVFFSPFHEGLSKPPCNRPG